MPSNERPTRPSEITLLANAYASTGEAVDAAVGDSIEHNHVSMLELPPEKYETAKRGLFVLAESWIHVAGFDTFAGVDLDGNHWVVRLLKRGEVR